ncbi:hypothetical protein [Thalassotalea aquiviva]|uniref:DUF7281 domain-containing protein n=1 Tax=Thalassotalea aquiviva TaxID=3242415 RepID=UPI00352A3EBD
MKITAGMRAALRKFIYSDQRYCSPRVALFLIENDFQDIAKRVGNRMLFTARDKIELEKALKQELNSNIFQVDLNQSRLDVAKHVHNEKLAKVNPDQDYVLLRSLHGPLDIFNPPFSLPNGSSLRIGIKHLLLDNIKRILVVENLVAFDHIEQANFPDDFEVDIVLYRGHGISNSGTNNLLQSISTNTEVVAFTDYDPKGVDIAFHLPNVTRWLYPQYYNDINKWSSLSDYSRQHSNLNYLLTLAELESSGPITTLLKHQLSIKQEHMLAHNLKLEEADVFAPNKSN